MNLTMCMFCSPRNKTCYFLLTKLKQERSTQVPLSLSQLKGKTTWQQHLQDHIPLSRIPLSFPPFAIKSFRIIIIRNNFILFGQLHSQGATKVSFTAWHSGKPQIHLLQSPRVFDEMNCLPFICNLSSPKNLTCPSGKLRTQVHQPYSKIYQPQAIGHDFLCTLILFNRQGIKYPVKVSFLGAFYGSVPLEVSISIHFFCTFFYWQNCQGLLNIPAETSKGFWFWFLFSLNIKFKGAVLQGYCCFRSIMC